MDIKKILFKTKSIDVEKSLPDAIIFCSNDGKIQWVNDKALILFETSKMHLMTSKLDAFIENPFVMINNSVEFNRSVITKSANKEIYYEMTASSIEEGFVLDFRPAKPAVSVIDDKNEEESINRDKNNFLIKLTNDLKSPLQSIVGFSQAMADGLGGEMSVQQEKYIKIINKNSTELMYFVAKLLELSQTEMFDNEIAVKKFDVMNLVSTVVKYNEQLYKDKEIKISYKASESLKKTINSNEDLLRNILQDVLEVILKSVDIGDIEINVTTPDIDFLESKKLPKDDYVLLSISCSSLLLAENDLDCIFDPYKILDSNNRKNVLRAMILASVKNMVQALKGIIWVESQILKSTNFNILIPNKE